MRVTPAATRDEGIVIFDASTAYDVEALYVQALALVLEAGIEFESVFDPDGRLLLKFDSLPPSAIPTTIVVDAQGRVAARILGETTQSTLTGIVEDTAAGS